MFDKNKSLKGHGVFEGIVTNPSTRTIKGTGIYESMLKFFQLLILSNFVSKEINIFLISLSNFKARKTV